MKLDNASFSFAVLMGVFGSCSRVQGHFHQSHGDHLHAHHEQNHRITNSLASDFSTSGRADVFDSCLITCYEDIVSRYGKEFAEYLRLDGFVFETCPYDEVNTTDTTDEYATDSRRSKQRNLNRILGATNLLSRLWTTRGDNGKLLVPFKVKPTSAFGQETLDTIGLALEHIQDATGVLEFIERTDEEEYIYFSYETYYANICASNLGKQTNTSTKVYLGWCREKRHKGNIIHEILHALGFWHEHSRPDRDNFININWDNVAQGAERNLEKAEEVNSLGSAYDYGSIMHYPSDAYSINSSVATIANTTVLNKWDSMGQRVKLSDNDIEQLRLLYQCQSGPRSGPVGMDELCSEDCPCWEHALGECTSDNECMGDLVCENTPDPLPIPEYDDQLPPYPLPSGIIPCDDYCHMLCCKFPDNVIACPKTCDTAPPQEMPASVPLKMCIKDPNQGVTTTVATSATGATRATTTTTTSTSSNPAKWYVDWGISKCVQSCDGLPPCGGIGQYVAFHNTVELCCAAHLYWISFPNCHTIPSSPPPSKRPTDKPTHAPSHRPSSSKPVTLSPSLPPNTESPSTNAPTRQPITNTPITSLPTNRPTSKPSSRPSTNNAVFYIDWNISKCVQDCIGSAPCGGLKPAWVAGYSSVETCCSTMSWKPFAECSNVPLAPPPTRKPTNKPTNMPSHKPTAAPTFSPTLRSPTVQPTAPPPSTSPSSKSPNNPVTSQPSRSPFRSPTKIPSSMPTTKPSNGDTRWYPGISKCLDDGKAPSWQSNRYTSQTTCCSNHFNWDYNNCLGVKQQPTYKWYADWVINRCVQDCDLSEGGSCGGLVGGSYVITHNSVEACCSAHMSYKPISQCKHI